jgi:hypothetical protein
VRTRALTALPSARSNAERLCRRPEWYLQRLNSRDTWYLGKAYEREVNAGQISTERYYLTSGSLLLIQTTGRKLNYLHTDRLGSPVSITEKAIAGQTLGTASPSLVEHKGFDPFGKALALHLWSCEWNTIHASTRSPVPQHGTT